MSNPNKRFSVGGFHIPYSLSEIQDTPEVIAAIDKLEVGESWDDGNGSETVTRLADADTISITLTTDQLATVIHALGIAERHVTDLVNKTCVDTINVRNHIPTAAQTAMQAEFNRMAWGFADLNVMLSKLTSNG